MKNFIFKLSILVFLLSMLLGFYSRLPLIDNIIRSFVIFILFFLAIWIMMLVYVHTLSTARGPRMRAPGNSKENHEHSVRAAH